MGIEVDLGCNVVINNGSGVKSVTGSVVDNSDPLNPVIKDEVNTSTQTALNGKEPTITPGDIVDFYRGDKTFQVLNKATIGLGNVDNTTDANKPVSTATQSLLDEKVNSVTIGEPTGSDVVGNIISLTQAEYDLGTPVSTTTYLITDA